MSEDNKYVPCHKGNVRVFDHDDVVVYGGGYTRGADEGAVDVVIDLAASIGGPWVVPNEWESRRWLPLVLTLKLPDWEAPVWDKRFWPALWGDLLRYRDSTSRKTLSVLVMCSGGHGRTGTVLACLAAGAHVIEGDPVEWVRKRYCDSAVESQGQIEYVEYATGLLTKVVVPKYAALGGDETKKASTYLGGGQTGFDKDWQDWEQYYPEV